MNAPSSPEEFSAPVPERPETVRIAQPDDVAGLYWHLLGDLEADNSLHIPVSERAVFQTVSELCNGGGGIAGIIDGPHGPVASIGIRAIKPWFSDQWLLSQVWLFVTPQARKGTRFGDDLFRFADWHRREMSQTLGYDLVLDNTILSFNRLEAKERFWSRYGKRVGAVFFIGGENG